METGRQYFVDIDECQVRSFLVEYQGHLLADALSGAGDEHRLARDILLSGGQDEAEEGLDEFNVDSHQQQQQFDEKAEHGSRSLCVALFRSLEVYTLVGVTMSKLNHSTSGK